MRQPSVLGVERSEQTSQCAHEEYASETRLPTADTFASIYRRHFRDVYGYCWNRLRQQQAAEDATGQVFLQALQGMSNYRETGRLQSWLISIAHNVVVSQVRKERPTEPLDRAEAVFAADQPPEDAALAALDLADLERAIAALPEEMRAAVELRRYGLTGEEVAAELGISHAAVKKRQSRALAILRERLHAQESGKGGHRGS